ncbi:MAG TPA: sigma-70 family RNA polymerase sigma factor [Methylomirabilota bacterium]|nr:sigma-70 family RNA polymerase sigma factor [Methylomirabilota bacterium]
MTRPFAAAVSADQSWRGAGPDFNRLIAENQRRVLQIAYGVLGNTADAEEVAQETFLRAFRKFPSLREPERVKAWLNRIAFRLALNRQRASRRRAVRDTTWHGGQPASTGDEAARANERLLVEQLREQIAALPERLRDVLQLSLAEGMSAGEVGAALGLPAATIRSRLHSAKKLLLERMK